MTRCALARAWTLHLYSPHPWGQPRQRQSLRGGGSGDGGDGGSTAYELFAILIHSGSAAGGHYHAYIKDTLASAATSAGGDGGGDDTGLAEYWCDYNDAHVTAIRREELERMMGGTATASTTATATNDVDESPSSIDAGNAVTVAPASQWGSSANAYMLVYRQRGAQQQAEGLAVTAGSRSQEPEEEKDWAAITALLPAELVAALQEEEKEHARLRALYAFGQRVVSLRVCSTDGRIWTVQMLQETTLHQAVQQVLDELPPLAPVAAAVGGASTSEGGDPYSKECATEWRLRRYSSLTGRAGETFNETLRATPSSDNGDDDDSSSSRNIAISSLGWVGGGVFDVMLEARNDRTSDPPFTPYNPNEMLLHIVPWSKALAKAHASTTDARAIEPAALAAAGLRSVIVPGDQLATVATLRAAVAAAFGLSALTIDEGIEESAAAAAEGIPGREFWLVCPTAGSSKAEVLTLGPAQFLGLPIKQQELDPHTDVEHNGGDSRLLRKHCGVQSGDRLYMEFIACDGEGVIRSRCAAHFEALVYAVTIVFNDLGAEPDEYPHRLQVDLRDTLLHTKHAIATQLGLDVETFHLRRGTRAPMLKKEAVTLRALGLSEGSPLCVVDGPVLGEGEYLLKVMLYHEGVLSLLTRLKAQATADVAVLAAEVLQVVHDSTKQKILAAREPWITAHAGAAAPNVVTAEASADQRCEVALSLPRADAIRLRDCQGTEVGKVLRHGRTLKAALTKLADGRELAVQLLPPDAPVVGAQDIILGLRRWRVCEKTVEPLRELVVRKSVTWEELRATIAATTGLEGYCRAPTPTSQPELATPEPESEQEPEPAAVMGAPPPLLRLGLAKAFSRGPPLEHGTAIKLAWNDKKLLAATSDPHSSAVSANPANSNDNDAEVVAPTPISRPPFSLRDGSVLVYCDEEDRARAKARAMAARAAAGGEKKKSNRRKPGVARRASAFQMMGSGGSRGGAAAPAERVLTIHAAAGPAKPTAGGNDDGGGDDAAEGDHAAAS